MKVRAAALALLVAVLAGCAPAYRKLPTLDEVPELAALQTRAERQRIAVHRLPVGEAGGRAFEMVAEELGANRDDELVVLVHGLFSDRTTWTSLAAHLGETRRLFIPDLIGNGESDRPDPALVGEAAYGPTGAARHLLRALRERDARETPQPRIVLVGHSLGGAVVLRALGSAELRAEFPDILSRVDRAVLVAPLEFAVHRADPTVTELGSIGAFKATLARVTGILRNTTAKELLAGAERPEWVVKRDVDRVRDAFASKRHRLAAQATLRAAVPFDEEGRPDWPAIERLVADYANVDVPVLIVWGNRDETLPLAMGYKLRAELPNARLRIVREGKHSIQADRPRFLAGVLERFLASDGAGGPPIATIGD